MTLALITDTEQVAVGDTFDVAVQAQSGSRQVVGVDVHLNYVPSKLAVVDMNPAVAGIQITGGTTLTTPLWNLAANTTGQLDYSAGILGGAGVSYPAGSFTIATIRFQALAETAPTTEVTFSISNERPTYVSGDTEGTDVTGTLTGGTYTIMPEYEV